MKEIKYILTESELKFLLQDQKRLEALEAYGVDNWDGYEEAMNDEEFEVTDDDFIGYSRIDTAGCWSANTDESTWSEE